MFPRFCVLEGRSTISIPPASCQAVRPDHSMFAPSLVRMRTPKANRTQGYFTHHVWLSEVATTHPTSVVLQLALQSLGVSGISTVFVSSGPRGPRLQFCAIRAPAGNRSDDSDFVMRYLVPNVHRPTCMWMFTHSVYISGVPFPPLTSLGLCTYVVLYELDINVRARVCPSHHQVNFASGVWCVMCVCVCARVIIISRCAYVYVYAHAFTPRRIAI